MTHVLPQQQIVEAPSAEIVENLTEDLADDLGVQTVLLEDHVELGQQSEQLVQGFFGVDVTRSVQVIVCAVLSSSLRTRLVVGETANTFTGE